ncbi:MAG: FAD-dependent oxidoreductase [Candidatus Arcticimaribacter sp.]|nr:MAG: FAD-dependent oxidoreductase [Candidatus Arcticimaribacter sp.]
MKHSLIVGLGLAGLAYAEHLRRAGLSFCIIDGGKGGSSQIAAGIYNPTVLKRFSLSWNGDLFHSYALPFYEQLQSRLDSDFIHPAPIHKIFIKQSEHNDWVSASDQQGLKMFLDPKIHANANVEVNATLGHGQVDHTGRVATQTLLKSFRNSLQPEELTMETFEYDKLETTAFGIQYKQIKAEHIVFCEGYQMVNNPFFKMLPLIGLKGEILIIKAPTLKSESILKGPIFIAPIGDDLYWAGATFERNDKTLNCTSQGRSWVEERIRKMISSEYEVIEHITQIRPTVMDRRPLIGTHPDHQNIHLLNGFGARGVLGAPLLSKWLLDHIEGISELPTAVNLSRFESYFRQSD